MDSSTSATLPYGKRLHQAARSEFRKFWSDYRLWATVTTGLFAPVGIQVARHGWSSMVNVGETLVNALAGGTLSMLLTYVVAMRKGAEAIDADQGRVIGDLQVENTALQIKPYDSALLETATSIYERAGADGKKALGYLLIYGETVEGQIPCGNSADERERILRSLEAMGAIKRRVERIPNYALFEYWRITENLVAPLGDLISKPSTQ